MTDALDVLSRRERQVFGFALWRSTKHGDPVDPRKLAETERAWLVIVVAILLPSSSGRSSSRRTGTRARLRRR